MAQYLASSLRRGESGLGAFPTNENLGDLKVADTIVVDQTERNVIEEWRRVPYMTAYVIGDDKTYRLGTDVTIAGQVWTEVVYSDPNALVDADVFDSDGYFLPSKMRNLFINDSFVVASQAAMLALTTVTGNAVIRTDTGAVFIKLNNNNPSILADFADITANTGAVTSVNGATGAVSITIANLLAVPANLTAFNSAVAANSLVLSHSASISSLTTNKADLSGGTVPLSQLPYTFQSGLTRSTNEVILGGSLLYNTTITQGNFNFLFDASGSGQFGINFGSDANYDLIYRGTDGYLARLAKGTDGQVLKMVSGTLAWAAESGGGGGATAFTGLSDVPSSYTGASLKGVRVNAAETALEFYTTGGGGGITNSAVNTEMMKSDGTNAVSSGIFSASTGNLTLGVADGTYTIASGYTTSGSNLNITAGGTGALTLTSILNTINGITYSKLNGTATNSIIYPWLLQANTTNTAANGFGVGLKFIAENASGNDRIGAVIDAVYTDATNASEYFDLVFSTMTAGAAAAEVMRVNSAYTSINGYLSLGTASQSGTTRTILADGSGPNVAINLQTKGTGRILFVPGGVTTAYIDGTNMVLGASFLLRSSTDLTIRAGTTLSLLTSDIGAASGDSSSILIKTGDAGTVGDNNSASLFLALGTPNGAGLKGNIGLLSSSVSNWQAMQNGLFVADAIAAPTGNPTGGAFFYTDPSTHKPKWRVPGGTTYDLTGSFTITETEIDFGSTPTMGKSFTITDAGVSSTSKIMVTPSGNQATGRSGNDFEVDIIQFTAIPGTGSFTVYANCLFAVVGKRKIFYTFA